MNTFTERLLIDVSKVGASLENEPAIRPSFAKADIGTILKVMFSLIVKGVDTAAGIHRYLDARDCRFDRDTIEFLLNAFEGNDFRNHLWTRSNLGEYRSLIEGAPMSNDDLWDYGP